MYVVNVIMSRPIALRYTRVHLITCHWVARATRCYKITEDEVLRLMERERNKCNGTTHLCKHCKPARQVFLLRETT